MEDGSCIAGWMAGYSLSLSRSAQINGSRTERKRKLVFSVVVGSFAHCGSPAPNSSFFPAASSDSGPTFLPINLTLADCARRTDGYDVAAAASHFSLLKRESRREALILSHFNYWDREQSGSAEQLLSEERAKPLRRPRSAPPPLRR